MTGSLDSRTDIPLPLGFCISSSISHSSGPLWAVQLVGAFWMWLLLKYFPSHIVLTLLEDSHTSSVSW